MLHVVNGRIALQHEYVLMIYFDDFHPCWNCVLKLILQSGQTVFGLREKHLCVSRWLEPDYAKIVKNLIDFETKIKAKWRWISVR